MTKKFMTAILILLLIPGLAGAGLITAGVATGAASGNVSPTGSVYATAPKTYTLTAGTNYTLDYVKNNGKAVPGTQISGTGPWTYTVPLSSSSQTVYVYFKVSVPANPPQLIARAPANLTATVNTPQTISGATSTILYLQPGTTAKFKWSSTPAAVFNPISSSVTSPAYIITQFTAPAAGNYTATLTLTAPGATPSSTDVAITVPLPGVAASSGCLECHRGWAEATAYGGSSHAASVQGPACQSCHNPTGSDSHPFTPAVTLASCTGCHLDTSGNVPGHPIQIGTNPCVACHDPHSTAPEKMAQVPPHYNNITDGMYPASCADCHSTAADNAAIRHDWAGSGHADTLGLPWTADDFKTRSGCVRCHTTTGYVNFITSPGFTNDAAWGDSADKTKEVLTCKACHAPDYSKRYFVLYTSGVGTTFRYAFKPDPFVNISAPYNFTLNYSSSNLCMPCHTGTTNGEIIKRTLAAFPNFTAVGRLLNHSMVAGGIMENYIGYEYDGTPNGRVDDYNKYNTSHAGIGMNYVGSMGGTGTGNGGPCAGCHMTVPGILFNQHTLKVATKDAVTQNANNLSLDDNSICGKCHPYNDAVWGGGPAMTTTRLSVFRDEFASALLALKVMLQKKGLDPDATLPKNWGATSQERANNMGAYYNYLLLRDGDKGSYVHNPQYEKRLVFFSIDWLDDHDLNYSTIDAVNALLPDELDDVTKAKAINHLSWGSENVCLNCHLNMWN